MGQHPGLQQAGERVHQGIARHGGLAKNRSPYLIRRDEPPSGALPSNVILRFEKPPMRTLFFPSVQARAVALRFNPRVSY